MRCIFCNQPETAVKDSRETEEGRVIRRRRSCKECKGRFTTFERVQMRQLVVIKRSGAKRPFDSEKILKSIFTALRKRNFSDQKIDEISKKIILELESNSAREIPTSKIGKLIMQELAKIDPVAYIRFASVYQDFSTAQDFAEFISKINKN
jgi:transcriptional repressor NrdR